MESSDKYQAVKEEVTIIYQNKGRYGYRRITAELHNRGFHLNHNTIQWLMKLLGLACRVRIKKYRSYKGEVGKIAPNLLQRDFYAEKPNQKWVITDNKRVPMQQEVYEWVFENNKLQFEKAYKNAMDGDEMDLLRNLDPIRKLVKAVSIQ